MVFFADTLPINLIDKYQYLRICRKIFAIYQLSSFFLPIMYLVMRICLCKRFYMVIRKYNAGAETRETRQRFPVDSPATCYVINRFNTKTYLIELHSVFDLCLFPNE